MKQRSKLLLVFSLAALSLSVAHHDITAVSLTTDMSPLQKSLPQRILGGDDEHDREHHTKEDDHSDSSDGKPYGTVIGAAFLVNLTTLAGVVVLTIVPAVAKLTRQKPPVHLFSPHGTVVSVVIPAFACGAIIATAVFLLVPEALHLLAGAHGDSHGHGEEHGEGEDHHDEENNGGRFLESHEEEAHREDESHEDNEAEVAWKFGTALMFGFLLPIILSSCFTHHHDDHLTHDCGAEQDNGSDCKCNFDECGEDDEDEEKRTREDNFEGDDENATTTSKQANEVSDEKQKNSVVPWIKIASHVVSRPNYPLCSSILLGDAFHNFADGIFVGTGFLLCSDDVAWTIVAATVYHELAQEIADFFVLTTHGGLSIFTAVVLNFLSGISVLLGGVIVLAMDLTEEAVGVVLTVGAGVFFYVAACECVPRFEAKTVGSMKLKALTIFCFALGAIPIGLVLLNHEHCEDH